MICFRTDLLFLFFLLCRLVGTLGIPRVRHEERLHHRQKPRHQPRHRVRALRRLSHAPVCPSTDSKQKTEQQMHPRVKNDEPSSRTNTMFNYSADTIALDNRRLNPDPGLLRWAQKKTSGEPEKSKNIADKKRESNSGTVLRKMPQRSTPSSTRCLCLIGPVRPNREDRASDANDATGPTQRLSKARARWDGPDGPNEHAETHRPQKAVGATAVATTSAPQQHQKQGACMLVGPRQTFPMKRAYIPHPLIMTGKFSRDHDPDRSKKIHHESSPASATPPPLPGRRAPPPAVALGRLPPLLPPLAAAPPIQSPLSAISSSTSSSSATP